MYLERIPVKGSNWTIEAFLTAGIYSAHTNEVSNDCRNMPRYASDGQTENSVTNNLFSREDYTFGLASGEQGSFYTKAYGLQCVRDDIFMGTAKTYQRYQVS